MSKMMNMREMSDNQKAWGTAQTSSIATTTITITTRARTCITQNQPPPQHSPYTTSNTPSPTAQYKSTPYKPLTSPQPNNIIKTIPTHTTPLRKNTTNTWHKTYPRLLEHTL
jgi:hypothetical protein